MKILVSGGAGFIGSHTIVELLSSGYDVVCVDNLSNSSIEVIDKIEQICKKKITFYNQDLCDRQKTLEIFEKENVEAVMHFAGYKAVGESVEKPLEYYDNNINSTLNLLYAMRQCNVNNFVFSSSATVYGSPKSVPIAEDFEVGNTTNPYGTTKYFIERILLDAQIANSNLNIAILRYFNPVGAHSSGLIGENPRGIPNNLLPYIAKVAMGELPYLNVFGNDYNTPDGTGVRDYIHVVDLAKGHIAALEKLKTNCGVIICNLGTGKGYSVLDMIRAYEKASKKTVAYKIMPRRKGDIDSCYSNPDYAQKTLNWKAEKTLDDMCESSYAFVSKNQK